MAVLLTIFGSILTVLLGSRLAYVWQSRSARESRFYEATKRTLDGMLEAHRRVARLIGRRIYAATRVTLIRSTNANFEAASSEFKDANIAWNNELLLMEIDVRTLFKGPALLEFEALQSEMAAINRIVSQKLSGIELEPEIQRSLLFKIGIIRNLYFTFIREMIRETDVVFRQMHYGVVVNYERNYIHKFTTNQLFKSLWSGPINESAVLGSPDNFGLPVSIDELRLGVH